MTKEEQEKFNKLTDLMTRHMDNPYIASMGQAFHAEMEEKYGRRYAMEMTDRMMTAVCDARMAMVANPFIHPFTGEVLA